jgi:hypothetical protein
MGREDPQLKLRLTEELKDAITTAARDNGRSVNSEIADRLTKSFDGAYFGSDELAKIDARWKEMAEFVVSLAEDLRAAASREGELQGKMMLLIDALEQSNAHNQRLLTHLEKNDHVGSET